MLPNVPTATEAGLPMDMGGWFGVLVPAGTPKDIVDKIYTDIGVVLKDPDTLAKLAAQGMTPVGNTPEQFTKQIADELQKWSAIAKSRKLAVN